MAKQSLISRILQLPLATYVFYILYLQVFRMLLVTTMFPSCGTYNYDHIPRETLYRELYEEINPRLELKKSKPVCEYDSIIKSTKSINRWEVPMFAMFDQIPIGLVNGSYTPEVCNPKFSVAILITYRKRRSQLDVLIPYIHEFLKKQNIHYKIYIIEQLDKKPWNKGVLYNIGAKYAIADKFPCLILHDVDMLPLDMGNLYVCTKQPRHMSASIDKFRFVLIYDTLVGGVVAIRSDQYTALNGFSNRFTGWGGEDDDFSERILANNLSIVRFPREMSRYSMMQHHQQPINNERHKLLRESRKGDGLDSVDYQSVQVKYRRQFTVIGVKL